MNIPKEILDNYIQNPSDKLTTIRMAEYYMTFEQYSSAVTYFMRSLEACNDDDYLLKYHNLLSIAQCYNILGDRFLAVEQYCRFAKAECPDRPEAYYMLADAIAMQLVRDSKFELGRWIEVYENAKIGAIFGKVRDYPVSRYYAGINRLYVLYLMSLMRLGRLSEAAEFIDEVDINSSDDYVNNTLEAVKLELDKKYYKNK